MNDADRTEEFKRALERTLKAVTPPNYKLELEEIELSEIDALRKRGFPGSDVGIVEWLRPERKFQIIRQVPE